MTRRRRDEPEELAPVEILTTDLEHRLRRQRPEHPRAVVNPYNDGMADWPELIQGMSQKRRDEILDRINRHSGKM